MPLEDVYIPLLDGQKLDWKLRNTFATSVGGAIVAILAAFVVFVEYPEPEDVSDEHVARYYLYYFQVRHLAQGISYCVGLADCAIMSLYAQQAVDVIHGTVTCCLTCPMSSSF